MSRPKKEDVRDMFDNIAPTYDRLNHLLSFDIDRLWRRRTVRRAAEKSPERILDLATGTADLAIAMARKMPAARITGVDLSSEMLAIGRAKVHAAGLSERIDLHEGDAEKLPFADSCFDVVTIGFGIRNFSDIGAGLREACRVLRPGGRLIVLEFSTPRGKIFGPVYRFYFHKILPLIGRLVSKDSSAYSYLPDSVDHFPDYLLFLRMMREAGFGTCTPTRLMRGIAYIYEGTK